MGREELICTHLQAALRAGEQLREVAIDLPGVLLGGRPATLRYCPVCPGVLSARIDLAIKED